MRKRYFDIVIMLLVIGLCCFGVLMVFSASYYTYQQKANSTGLSPVLNQAKYMVLGLGVMILAMLFDYHNFSRFRIAGRFPLFPTLMLCGSVVLLLLAIFVGDGKNGADRWISIAGISIQPSEIARISLVIFVADQLSYYENEICHNRNFRVFLRNVWPTFAAALLICGLIFAGNALSMTVITGLTFMAMLYVADFNPRLMIMMGCGVTALGGMAIAFSDFRRKRMAIFMNPWKDIKGDGYQLVQSLYALGNGSLFGVGIGNSRQKFQFLTYSDSDYILAIIGEEIGFVGVLLLLLAYGLLIYRGFQVARKAPDRLGMLMALGITSVLTIQLIINILVVTSVMPPTGVPLPFISKGGTSLIIFLASMGVLLNISRFSTQE